MKIYWSERYNDYIFQGWYEDAPNDYHCYAYYIYESYLVHVHIANLELEFICEVK